MGWDSFPIPNSLGNAWKFHLTPGLHCALKQSPVWSDCSPVGRQAAARSRVIDWINSLIPNRWIEYWCLVSPHHRRKTQSASTAPKFNPLLPRSPSPGHGAERMGPALSARDPTHLNEKRYINLWDALPNHLHATGSYVIFCKVGFVRSPLFILSRQKRFIPGTLIFSSSLFYHLPLKEILYASQ